MTTLNNNIAFGTIKPQRLAEILHENPDTHLIDVRTPAEYRQVHIPQARLMPLDSLDPAEVREYAADDKTLYVVCHAGGRGAKACEQLAEAGITTVVNVEGGTTAWADAGLPVVRTNGMISIMRQVQIIAGSLILLGVVLGILVHPYLVGISAFVGAGLLFAGLTDTCGMAIILARMPWYNAPNVKNCSI
ncbi:rhodanese-like domain-containing protein [Mucisphaera calidilacus]|uniref:Inner membrane protein YgaP n=1 Tax=Mucisphaera calidilacus TaxID=2527982 RepID=A0A518BWS2_9BACT|nr:rhodanese-like domain-containing protein [Mucisphaera calidilacus]QDU71384.1 Inner membrane protein YgaP [Mucisphaera calidilacus]